MSPLNCAAARRRLQAYHDGELSVAEQIAVSGHLDWCDACGALLTDLQGLRAALRVVVPGRMPPTHEESASLTASVVARVRAEQAVSLGARVRDRFGDMRVLYAGMGAAAATVVCLLGMSSMMRFATRESPGSNQNPMVVDARMLLPRAIDQVFVTQPSARDSGEAVYTFSAVVTREGRVVNLELHSEGGQMLRAGSSEAQAAESLMGAVSKARFEPARVAGLPVAVNMVWMVAHTTVRAAKDPFDPPVLPVVKKRVALIGPVRARPLSVV